MGGFSIWHWLVVGILILLLFGKGRFSSMMGDVADGLKSFKKGMAEEDEDLPPRRIDVQTTAPGATIEPTATAEPAPVEVKTAADPTDGSRA